MLSKSLLLLYRRRNLLSCLVFLRKSVPLTFSLFLMLLMGYSQAEIFAQTPAPVPSLIAPPPAPTQKKEPTQTHPKSKTPNMQNVSAGAWHELSADKQKILLPLQKEWDGYTPVQKKRWIGLANQYGRMTPKQQEKFNELLALPPEQRRAVRDTYKGAKKITPEQKQARWEYYKSLSPEEKQKFIEQSKKNKSGANGVSSKTESKSPPVNPTSVVK